MPLPAIELAFDPLLQLGSLDIRWQTIGVTAALLAALAVAARIGGYLSPHATRVASAASPAHARGRLRLDDLAYIVLGGVPGAVLGGRLVHGIVYWDAYAAQPVRLLDPGVGSLSLTGAVLGGALTGAYVAHLLAAPVRRWADAAAIPLLIAIGVGKLAQLLGGSGQGGAFEGAWAVAFVGDGPWYSLTPAVPAHPSQVYEGLWALLGIPLVLALAGASAEVRRILTARLARSVPDARTSGALFGAALGWFLLGRLVIGFTWRDEDLIGALNGEQLVALVGLALMALALALLTRDARGIVGRQETREEIAP